jgi:hypothetical protein
MWRLLEQGIGPPSHVGTRYFESERHQRFLPLRPETLLSECVTGDG